MAEQGQVVTVQVHSPPDQGTFTLRSMKMEDELGRPFRIELDLQHGSFEVDFDELLGKPMCVEMETEGGVRFFHGIVALIEHAGAASRFAIYKVILRPWPWLLTRTHDCRIWLDKTVPEIIKDGIFKDHGFSDFAERLSGTYVKREFCVQYRESDFDFASRLMEEEGIYYFFEHEKTKHTLVLCDATTAHKTVPNYHIVPYRAAADLAIYEREVITEWRELKEVESGGYVVTNFDFTKPTTSLEGRSIVPASHAQSKFEVFDYPGVHLQKADGDNYAKIRREELQVPYQRYVGAGNPRAIGVGNLFKLDDHPRPPLNKEYLVCAVRHDLSSTQHEMGAHKEHIGFRFGTEFQAIDKTRPFRPERRTPKPMIRGPQTAIVAGPKDDEIHTDKYGRVKLKFHWDRHGKADETASCWIRVAQAWAGKKWGQIYLPRIGQEVVVEFLEGDPDRPIVTGRVYNNDQMPPYDLPAEMTKSTIKTRSTTKGDDKAFNELRFEDKKDKEEVYFHAERDFNRVVENSDTLKVGFEKKDPGDQKIDIFNNQVVTIGDGGAKDGSQTMTIKKDRTVTIKEGNDSLEIKMGNRDTKITQGNDTLKISAGSQTVEAMQSITLKVGANKIVIDQSGITLDGIQITIKGSATLDAKSPLTTVAGTGVLTLQGGLVKIN
ncbi:MAG: type VI secretion system tip protein VgrG [Gammaproteobacteria bacterium]|nr:type VI secretion system tip protein VgrG [Gammaproteobacteria bacterium]MBI5615176.1 type VI secretion system tip protein VgrG [Gammaproteobacteria bacterium]